MKILSKITVHNAEDVLSSTEMRALVGGYDGAAKKCEDFTHSECTSIEHECAAIIDNGLQNGKCKWVEISAVGFSYSNCTCVIE